MTQAERLYHLNQQNRKKNLEEIRKAQIAEKKRDAESRAKATARKAEKERLEAEAAAAKDTLKVPGGDVDELFGSDVSRSGTPGPGNVSGITSGVNTPKRSGTPLGKKVFEKKEREGLPTFKKRDMDDEVIGSMDLGIDIDI